jgi:ABC-2 type transport system ATP-binding protein
MDRGRVVAEGTPGELKSALGGSLVEARLSDLCAVADAVAAIKALGNGVASVDPDRGLITIPATDGVATLQSVLRRLTAAGIGVEEIGVRRPSLDEVFLALTGEPREGGSP